MSLTDGVTPQKEKRPQKPREAQEWPLQLQAVINSYEQTIARRSMELHFEQVPELAARYGSRERSLYIQDAVYSLRVLRSAAILLTPEIYTDYMSWVRKLFLARKIPIGGMPRHIDCLGLALKEYLTPQVWEEVLPYLEAAKEPFL